MMKLMMALLLDNVQYKSLSPINYFPTASARSYKNSRGRKTGKNAGTVTKRAFH